MPNNVLDSMPNDVLDSIPNGVLDSIPNDAHDFIPNDVHMRTVAYQMMYTCTLFHAKWCMPSHVCVCMHALRLISPDNILCFINTFTAL